MAYLEYPNGGAVFSAGSICWRGSAVRPRLRRDGVAGDGERPAPVRRPGLAAVGRREPDRGRRSRRRSGRRSRTIRPAMGASRGSRGSASGAIVLSHRVGTTREGADGRPRLVRSDDGGATWRVLASPFVGALPAGWDLRGCALAETADGGLLAVVVALDKTTSAGRRTTPSPRGSSPFGTSSRAPTTAARRGPSPGSSRTAGTSNTRARVSSALPDGGAPVHVRDVQDVRRRPEPGATPAACCDPTMADGHGDGR